MRIPILNKTLTASKICIIVINLLLISGCNSNRYPEGTIESDVELKAKEYAPDLRVNKIKATDSIDTRAFSDTIKQLKATVHACDSIINNTKIVQTLLPNAIKLSNLLALYRTNSDYACKRYIVNGMLNNSPISYTAYVYTYPSKRIDIVLYDDSGLSSEWKSFLDSYYNITQFNSLTNAAEQYVNLAKTNRAELMNQMNEELNRRERERIAKENAERTAKMQKMREAIVCVKQLYNELMSFRYSYGFVNNGFSKEPYRTWMKNVESLQSRTPNDFIFEYGFSISELLAIGRHYVFSGGEDDEHSLYVRNNIENAIRKIKY